MKSLVLAAMAFGLSSTAALSMPLLHHAMPNPSLMENVRIVCEENGFCYRLPRRPLVARWIYGDGAFYGPGPYDGPRYYYGWPGYHYRWPF
jgi:hypothetical protein